MSSKLITEPYLSIKEQARYEEVIGGSRFIASAKPVTNEVELTQFLESVRREFHNANHNCFAWRLIQGRIQKYRYNDDKEPSNSAGQPIHKVLEGKGLTNICIIVTRYFGGTKLGIGGLKRAYTHMAQEVLTKTEIEKKHPMTNLSFIVTFDYVNVAHNIINSLEAELKDSQYSDTIKFIVDVRSANLVTFKNKLIEATNGQVKFI